MHMKILASRPQSLLASVGVTDILADDFVASLPFAPGDITAGAECEFQAVVIGNRDRVDLPIAIEQSNYYANIMRRVASGDTSRKVISGVERFLNENPGGIWENSWVRFPELRLSDFARQVFFSDLLADKSDRSRGFRSDSARFIYRENDERYIRIPVSYLLRLSLAEVIGAQSNLPRTLRETARRLMKHFFSDNSSPETTSFYIVPTKRERLAMSIGRGLARETSRRFLLSQLLLAFANKRFGLEAKGQRAMIYFAPHAPSRQRQLSACISDAFYRELFSSPCLAGWDKGEEKHAYMNLCHRVLSRSHLAAIAKLRDAGIITSNLVVFPHLSTSSLSSNGTHASLGSNKLTEALRSSSSHTAEEKYIGDLVIKIAEHFLPLFVGSYSAAPYRFSFSDFHPERVLGFLPHELDYTHLRMLWRRWKRKADIRVFGQPVTPFGPPWIDRAIASLFHLRGDSVTDVRLIDYLVALMSTSRSPGLDGTPGSGDRLKRDLEELGVFDSKMSLYLPLRLREFAVMGFSGFEARYFSQFESIIHDFGNAVDLQALITALAYKYIARGRVTHAHIPDDPFIESERRQVFFARTIGVPTFFVRQNSANQFLTSLIACTTRTRASRRYAGFMRVELHDYLSALVRILRRDGADLIEIFDMHDVINDLEERLENPGESSAEGRLLSGILEVAGASSTLQVSANEFNSAVESYYRNSLRNLHTREGIGELLNDVRRLRSGGVERGLSQLLAHILKEQNPEMAIAEYTSRLIAGTATENEITILINLTLASLSMDVLSETLDIDETQHDRYGQKAEADAAPVY
jgi:hypothetical protein